ncbi:MAG: protein translocase subunit SecF [Oscillospiraceae bacterium]
MKKIKKPVFFIVFLIIMAFTGTAMLGFTTQYGDITTTRIKGVSDIRLGIDIQGGVDVTFTPQDGVDATDDQLASVMEVMKVRLSSLNINDSEVYVDNDKDRVIVRFPWQSGETDFDPEKAVAELGETAMLRFIEGTEYDLDKVIAQGTDIKNAFVSRQPNDTTGDYDYVVALEFSDEGSQKFADATGRLYESNGSISIWMDENCVNTASVSAHITNGSAVITGDYDYDSAKSLADKINSGALPFNLVTSSFKTISPTLGSGALQAMILSGIIAFIFIAVYMIVLYRLPGFVSVIALTGQVAGTLAVVSGYFSFMDSSTLTIPGIAGIILAVGMGVDANIITFERIKEEIRAGRNVEKALENGYSRAFSAIFDGNITVIIVAIVLMGAFGVPSSIFAKALSWVFFMFGASAEGTIFSFGFTLMVGVILNFLMGVLASKLMLGSLAKFKPFKNKKMYCSEAKKDSKQIDFVSKKKVFFTASLVFIVLSAAMTFIGVDVDIEFKGGTIISYSYDGDINTSDAQAKIEEIVNSSVNIQTGDLFDSDRKNLTISFVSNDGLTAEKQNELTDSLKEIYAENEIELLDSNDVSPTAGREFFLKCLVAVIFSSILLIIYIALRFSKIGGISAGVCAVITLIHDVLIVYGIYIILGFSINSNFMAVILTILGYSINDTIVIYDRIRENRKLRPKAKLNELVNLSINQSIARSLRTSITTIVSMLSIVIVSLVFGVSSILSFAVPLIFGMAIGTYSSLCIASPLWVWWNERKEKKAKKK